MVKMYEFAHGYISNYFIEFAGVLGKLITVSSSKIVFKWKTMAIKSDHYNLLLIRCRKERTLINILQNGLNIELLKLNLNLYRFWIKLLWIFVNPKINYCMHIIFLIFLGFQYIYKSCNIDNYDFTLVQFFCNDRKSLYV